MVNPSKSARPIAATHDRHDPHRIVITITIDVRGGSPPSAPKATPVPAPPASPGWVAHEFLRLWREGAVPVPWTTVRSTAIHKACVHWCASREDWDPPSIKQLVCGLVALGVRKARRFHTVADDGKAEQTMVLTPPGVSTPASRRALGAVLATADESVRRYTEVRL